MPLIQITILSLTLLILAAGSSLAEPISINFSYPGVQNSPKRKACEYFKRLVEQRSNNRIKVSINPESTLNGQHSIEKLRSNFFQMAAPDISEFYALSPQLRLFEMPFIFNDLFHLHNVIDGEVGEQLLEMASQGDLIALSFWDNGFRQLTANQPLSRPEQAEGLRLHILGTDGFENQLLQLGARPQRGTKELLYTALKEKRLDGQENTLAIINELKLYQVQSNLTISNHSYTGFMVVTNKRFWSQLPEDLKVIVKGSIKSAADYTRDIAAQVDEESLEIIRTTSQIKIHRLTSKERKLWAARFQEIDSKSYRNISKELVRQAHELQIR